MAQVEAWVEAEGLLLEVSPSCFESFRILLGLSEIDQHSASTPRIELIKSVEMEREMELDTFHILRVSERLV